MCIRQCIPVSRRYACLIYSRTDRRGNGEARKFSIAQSWRLYKHPRGTEASSDRTGTLLTTLFSGFRCPKMLNSCSEIAEFYRGRSVFVTGATGFLGKVLVEKLLRSCPHLERVYILLRPLGDKTLACRFQEFINNKVTKRSSISIC